MTLRMLQFTKIYCTTLLFWTARGVDKDFATTCWHQPHDEAAPRHVRVHKASPFTVISRPPGTSYRKTLPFMGTTATNK